MTIRGRVFLLSRCYLKEITIETTLFRPVEALSIRVGHIAIPLRKHPLLFSSVYLA
jgi:hypothetical protein